MDEPQVALRGDSRPAEQANRKKLLRACVALMLLAGVVEASRRWSPAISHEIRYQRASYLLDAGKFDEATARLEFLIEGHPREMRARLALARAYRLQGRITEAEETLQRAVELGLSLELARPEHDRLKASGQPDSTNLADR